MLVLGQHPVDEVGNQNGDEGGPVNRLGPAKGPKLRR